MRRILLSFFLLLFLVSCHNTSSNRTTDDTEDTLRLKYATHINIIRHKDYTEVTLQNPWKEGEVLHSYALVDSAHQNAVIPDGFTRVRIPLRRIVSFTTAHASLLDMLHARQAVCGVCDAQYMLLPWVHNGLSNKTITDCGNAMSPNIERIMDLKPDAIILSPFENSGYGKLTSLDIPLIESADYMETSALGRAEWMRFYGLLVGREKTADSLFSAVENHYNQLKALPAKSKVMRKVIPDRKTSAVWYMPGGQSSVSGLYKDARVRYAFADDNHSGSLPLSFETVIDQTCDADIWILSYQGSISLRSMLSECEGYANIKAFKNGDVYGCAVDRTPYFEEVSFRPDWLLRDYVILFHPDLKLGQPRYYHKIK